MVLNEEILHKAGATVKFWRSAGRTGAEGERLAKSLDEFLNPEDMVMAKNSYKILLFMKRRPGMTIEAFQDYYENHHVPLVSKYTASLSRYVRRYLVPHPNPETGESGELPYDVITELWFDDETIFNDTVKYLATSIMPDEVVEDEKQLFDRPRLRMATVVECESNFAK